MMQRYKLSGNISVFLAFDTQISVSVQFHLKEDIIFLITVLGNVTYDKT